MLGASPGDLYHLAYRRASAWLVSRLKRPRLTASFVALFFSRLAHLTLAAIFFPVPSRVGVERLLQRARDGDRFELVAFPGHAGDLLFAARDEFLVAVHAPPVFKGHGHAVLRERAQPHPNQNLVERIQLGEVLAGAARRNQAETFAELLQNLRGVIAQEHLAAAPLPADVAGVIDIPHEVRLLEADHVPVFIGPHLHTSTRRATARRAARAGRRPPPLRPAARSLRAP